MVDDVPAAPAAKKARKRWGLRSAASVTHNIWCGGVHEMSENIVVTVRLQWLHHCVHALASSAI
eukprot:8929487-Pyramimonas_sp.AAC.1